MNSANTVEIAGVDLPSPIRSVAVIGAGSMGQPMAGRICDAGFALTVCDKNDAALQEFAALGVSTTAMPSDCVDCDAVIVLVATPEQVRAVMLGAEGLQGGARAAKPQYVVVMSTVSPQDMRELAASLDGTPIRLVDAPVSGGVVGARRGTLTVLAGGAGADIAALSPLFAAVGKEIFHCGALGAGQATKIVNNLIAISNLLVSAEAYRIAQANGLALDRILPAFEAGSARNFLSRDATYAREIYASWSGSVQEYRAVLEINQKDVDLALSICPPGVALPAIGALRELVGSIGDETLATWRAVIGEPAPSGVAGAIRNQQERT